MKALLKKELKSLFYSSRAGYLAVVFSILLAMLVWGIGRWFSVGECFTPSYPSFVRVMSLFPPLLLLLIAVFYAFYFLSDRRKYLLERLLVNPTRFYWSTFLRPLLFVSIILLVSLTYAFTNLYINESLSFLQVIITYIFLLLVCSVFISICSLVAIFVNRSWWILLLGILLGGTAYFALSPMELYDDYSLKYNFEEVASGTLSSRFVVLIVNYHLIAFILVVIFLQWRKWRNYLPYLLLLLAVNISFCFIADWQIYFMKKPDGIAPHSRSLYPQAPKDIAFIEGHHEVEQVYLLDAEKILARDYNIHRGEIGEEVGVLDGFAAVIIVGPTEKFSEKEKYVLDRYLMQGGKILWLIDGVYISHTDLATQGWSASIRNDVNLDNMLHAYGIRVKPQLIVDAICDSIRLISQESGHFVSRPHHFAPRLEVRKKTRDNIIMHNISRLATSFMSPIDTLAMQGSTKQILFSSSPQSNIVTVPERIDFLQEHLPALNQSPIPMAVALAGRFNSVYTNDKSVETKMIVIGGSSLIKNELQGQGDATNILPMAYNRHTEIVADNSTFLQNAVNWLTEDVELLALETEEVSNTVEKTIGIALFLAVNLLIPLLLYYFLFFRGSRRRKKFLI